MAKTILSIIREYDDEPDDARMRELLRLLIGDKRPSAEKPNIVPFNNGSRIDPKGETE